MLCPNCKQEIQATDAFCGNCGQAIAQQPASVATAQPAAEAVPAATPVPQPDVVMPQASPQPAMTVPTPTPVTPTAPATVQPTVANQQVPMAPIAGTPPAKSSKPLSSLLFGIGGLLGALVVPIMGIGFGIAAIVLGTQSMKSKKGLAVSGLILGILAIVLAILVIIIVAADKVQKGELGNAIFLP